VPLPGETPSSFLVQIVADKISGIMSSVPLSCRHYCAMVCFIVLCVQSNPLAVVGIIVSLC
jgi:hypothetical protein